MLQMDVNYLQLFWENPGKNAKTRLNLTFAPQIPIKT